MYLNKKKWDTEIADVYIVLENQDNSVHIEKKKKLLIEIMINI